jgi:hexosaminidase
MLDDGRYFHGTVVVKKILDLLALHKMNRFHWHLTEDQGWRIEIKKYPKLTELGSKRKQTQIGGFLSKKRDGQPHGGFYTQLEIKEIVEYAADRFITIIPEIEMPGHAQAAIAAYPEFSCTGGPFEVSDHFGIHKDVFCPGKEGTFQFYQDVIDEVVALFPSEVFHIGGDETPKARWKTCPDCQRRIQQEKLTDEAQLQVYFTNRMEKYLASKGKRLMGWNEILGKGLSPKAIAQYWTGPPSRILPDLQQGREMVMSAFRYVYIDHWYEFTSLEKAYSYEPIPAELQSQYYKNVLGLETTMWSEWVPTLKRLEYQSFPRTCAYAEIGWSAKDGRDYKGFMNRLEKLLPRLDKLGVQYAPKKDWNPSKLRQLLGLATLPIAPKGGW